MWQLSPNPVRVNPLSDARGRRRSRTSRGEWTLPANPSMAGYREIRNFQQQLVRLKIAQSRSYHYTLGPKLSAVYVLGAPRILPAVAVLTGKARNLENSPSTAHNPPKTIEGTALTCQRLHMDLHIKIGNPQRKYQQQRNDILTY